MTPEQEERMRAMFRKCYSEWIMLSPETWEDYPQPAPRTRPRHPRRPSRSLAFPHPLPEPA